MTQVLTLLYVTILLSMVTCWVSALVFNCYSLTDQRVDLIRDSTNSGNCTSFASHNDFDSTASLPHVGFSPVDLSPLRLTLSKQLMDFYFVHSFQVELSKNISDKCRIVKVLWWLHLCIRYQLWTYMGFSVSSRKESIQWTHTSSISSCFYLSAMPYQRLIFSLLYDSGSFCLSRNFRLQRVGSINWLLKNYDLAALCSAIDELVLLNVSRSPFEEKYNQKFFDDLNLILQHCFCPVTIGGGVAMLDHAKRLIGVGADKVVISTAITHNLDLVHQISQVYGAQAVSLWLDCTHSLCRFNANTLDFSLSSLNNFVKLNDFDFGDVVLHSIDRDGTGQGFDLKLINTFSTLSMIIR